MRSCGKLAIDLLKAVFLNELIIADMKIIVIGLVFGKVSFYVKADLMTIIHPADINTLKRNFQLVKIS